MRYVTNAGHKFLNFLLCLDVLFFFFLSSCFCFLVLFFLFAWHFWCSISSFLFLKSVFIVDLYPAVHDGFCYSFYSIKVFFLLFNVIDNQIPTIKKEMQ